MISALRESAELVPWPGAGPALATPVALGVLVRGGAPAPGERAGRAVPGERAGGFSARCLCRRWGPSESAASCSWLRLVLPSAS